ncbi:MAG TPA: tetratricopeptide repeat protein [Alphaproteobacteria bacterium]|nr:tetratricopeptide repeat protein [Alphaproteobacteria bacterium]
MNRQPGQFHLLRKPAFICLLLVLATLAVYFPVGNFGFVGLDDSLYFFSNPHVLSGLTWSNAEWAFTSDPAAEWHPLTWLSLMLNASLFGDGPVAPHLTNALLHAINSILVFRVFGQMTGAMWRSAALAMVFAIHPLHVESVAWITERKDVLSGFFGLLTLLCYAQYVELAKTKHSYRQPPENTPTAGIDGGQTPRFSWMFYGLALFFFACGMMSKAMLVTLPCVLLLLDFWPLQRFNRQMAGRIIFEKIPFFLLAAAGSVVVYIAGKESGSTTMLINDPLPARLANAFVSYTRYLAKTFCPIHLAISYPLPLHWPISLVIFSVILFAFLCAAAVAMRKKFPFAFTGWFWFAGMLVPVIGLVQAGVQSMADRFVYLPLIGVSMAVIWGAAELCVRLRLPERAIVLWAALLFLACGIRAANQVAVWKDDGTLFGHAVAVTKNNYVASLILAYWYSTHGRAQDALKYYDDAMHMSSNDLAAISYSTHTRTQAALYNYYNSLRLNTNNPDQLYNIGNASAKLGNWDEAIRDYDRALQLAAGRSDIMNNLGFALVKERRYAAAATNFLAVLKLEPASVDAHNNLASIYFLQGQYGQAAEQFHAALQLSPRDPRLCVNLAQTFLRLDETNQAIKYYRQALQLQPDNAQIQAELHQLGAHSAN